MSITYGFYNSLNGDKKYNAVQMSQIFDGLIIDGVYASIGTCFVVKANAGENITVGIGRAWFNHTWTYNDSILPLKAPISEVLLDRIDAIVLEINSTEAIRTNDIKIIKGKPSSSPTNPELSKDNGIYQYPLCYIYRKAGSSEIRQADITNKVGSEETPFVLGVLKTLNMSELLGQWEDKLDQFIAEQEKDFTDWMNLEKSEYNKWYKDATDGNDTWMTVEKEKFKTWIDEQKSIYYQWFADLKADLSKEQKFLDDWVTSEQTDFTAWMNEVKSVYDEWAIASENAFDNWFNEIKGKLSTDQAGNLQLQIDKQEINRILLVGFIDGSKEFSDDGTVVTSIDTIGRKVVKTFSDGFFKSTSILTNQNEIELATLVKDFDQSGKLINTKITYKGES